MPSDGNNLATERSTVERAAEVLANTPGLTSHVETMSDGYASLIIHDDCEVAQRAAEALDAAGLLAQCADGNNLAAAVEALADEFEAEIDWSSGRGNYGDNAAWESVARRLRALLAEDDRGEG